MVRGQVHGRNGREGGVRKDGREAIGGGLEDEADPARTPAAIGISTWERAVDGGERKLSAHLACAEHQHRRKEEGDVRHDLHQGDRTQVFEPHLQESRRRHEQAVRDARDIGNGRYDSRRRKSASSGTSTDRRLGSIWLTFGIHSAGELSQEEIENLMQVVSNPRTFKVPDWFLNRQKDYKTGTYSQLVSSQLDTKLREDLERLKKIRNHRGLRHYWGIKVRGQHTKTTGRRGRTVGVASKK
mmetsp:Transcript_1107/g.7136  ORF Transcript_1107/g.7136 Transcript_1107/m.7136 type:complete len:242 (+) Transcript_1107:132-857(+)